MFNNKAMLVDLTISMWTGHKFDQVVSESAAANFNASNDAGRYNKTLIDKKLLKPITSKRTELETYHKDNTAIWFKNGGRLLPSINYMTYTGEMRRLKNAYIAEVETFLQEYPAAVQQAQKTLGNMYNADDYPTTQELRKKFDVIVDITPLPDIPDVRITMMNEIADEAIEAMKETYARKENSVVQESFKRARDVVSKMYDTLKDPEKIFRDSLVSNIETITELLPALNLTADPTLTEAIGLMKSYLIVSPQELRDNPVFRAQTSLHAARILNKLNGQT